MSDGPRQYRSDDALFRDPRFQRRVVAIYCPIAIIDNMFDVTLECGHAPLLFSDAGLKVGEQCFCPTCYEEAEKAK